jgi:hypothetical protein
MLKGIQERIIVCGNVNKTKKLVFLVRKCQTVLTPVNKLRNICKIAKITT